MAYFPSKVAPLIKAYVAVVYLGKALFDSRFGKIRYPTRLSTANAHISILALGNAGLKWGLLSINDLHDFITLSICNPFRVSFPLEARTFLAGNFFARVSGPINFVPFIAK